MASKNCTSEPSPLRRIGIIGDVHGEHVRLERLLGWFSNQRVDALVCTGDIADGRGCLQRCCELLRSAGVHTVSGNHDRWFLQDRVRHVANAHDRSALDERTISYLEARPRTVSLETVAGPLLLCHGVGENDLGKVWPGTERSPIKRSDEMDAILEDGHYRFVINGHLHYRVMIDFHDALLINAGTLAGQHAGVSVVDLSEGWVSAYSVEDCSAPPERIIERPLNDPARQAFANTQAFDGRWTPITLHGA